MVEYQSMQPWGLNDASIGAQLDRRAIEDGEFVYCRIEGRDITFSELADSVNRLVAALDKLGVGQGDRVPVMLGNHLDHVVIFFALLKLGACQVPVNVHLRADGLRYILSHSAARHFVVDGRYAEQVDPVLAELGFETVVWRHRPGHGVDLNVLREEKVRSTRPCLVLPEDTVIVSYTSGTTGLPKGVILTDKMLRTCAHAAARLTEVRLGDTLYVWEPFYHIGGSEVLVLGILERPKLAIVERFSVTRFWSDVRDFGATHIHFLGGVLALLLKEPPRPDDRDHPVRIAWGGGCPAPVWRQFEDRFGIQIRECYGMTEASSFTTQNLEGKVGSVGKPLPWLDVAIVSDDGRFLGPDQRGEFWVREKVPGVLMRGYFNNPEATAEALKDGWLRTGDVGWFDADGFYYFSGRKKDSIRRRGENITAFEIERAANEHPAVAESAAIGVPNELSDEDVKILLRLKPGMSLDPLDFIRWCEQRLAYFQIPRYVAFIDEFPKTPTERIRKDSLSRDTSGIFDLERSGYRIKRV